MADSDLKFTRESREEIAARVRWGLMEILVCTNCMSTPNESFLLHMCMCKPGQTHNWISSIARER